MEKVMEDCTIIIQGKLEKESYDFYIKKYDNINIRK
jgi:hypothetical protein